jgi:hypothetical protein
MLRVFLEQHPDDLPALPPLVTRKPTSYDLPPEPEIKHAAPRGWQVVFSMLAAIIPLAARSSR